MKKNHPILQTRRRRSGDVLHAFWAVIRYSNIMTRILSKPNCCFKIYLCFLGACDINSLIASFQYRFGQIARFEFITLWATCVSRSPNIRYLNSQFSIIVRIFLPFSCSRLIKMVFFVLLYVTWAHLALISFATTLVRVKLYHRTDLVYLSWLFLRFIVFSHWVMPNI